MTLTTNFLRRYTNLPSLIQILSTRTLTFLDPRNWDDKNDSYFMQLYKDKRSLQTLLALCFSQETETYHHWRVFADGSSGVCIAFKKEQLLSALKSTPEIRHGAVDYLKLADLKSHDPKPNRLPFLKRAPFEPEAEFRILYESKKNSLPFAPVDIPLECIDRITLSPWMPKSISDAVRGMIEEIPKGISLDVSRSTLIQNDTWSNFGRSVVGLPSTKKLRKASKKSGK
jgi:hypothetical protein